MSSKRQYNGRFKAQVALDAIKSEKTIGEIASHYSIHPSQNLSQRRLGYTNGRSIYWMNCPICFLRKGKGFSKITRKYSLSCMNRSAS